MLGESSNFIEAASTCTSEGAKLVSFTSEEEIWAFQMLTGSSTEAKRGSEKKQRQDQPIEKWLVRQGLIGREQIWAKLYEKMGPQQ